ncbi:MAG: glycine/sarcosine/betaine reductase selenoprotein B family protein [Myxococcota bacterium]
MSEPTSPAREVDPWRFAGGFLQKVLSAGIPDTPKHPPIPWTPVTKPLSASKLALVTTSGLSMQGDPPFDMEFERRNPTRGDPSWRAIRADATGDTVEANHLHVDTSYVKRDIDVALPLDRARELVAEGVLGALAETHYSTMGYQGNDATSQAKQSAPEIAASMRREEVDLALLAPV